MIFTKYINLPASIGGFVLKDANDDCTVLINPKFSYEMQRVVARHELDHANNDFDDIGDVGEIETKRHK